MSVYLTIFVIFLSKNCCKWCEKNSCEPDWLKWKLVHESASQTFGWVESKVYSTQNVVTYILSHLIVFCGIAMHFEPNALKGSYLRNTLFFCLRLIRWYEMIKRFCCQTIEKPSNKNQSQVSHGPKKTRIIQEYEDVVGRATKIEDQLSAPSIRDNDLLPKLNWPKQWISEYCRYSEKAKFIIDILFVKLQNKKLKAKSDKTVVKW